MPYQDLYNKIFAGASANERPKELLKNIVSEYPYFSLAHFFLLKEAGSTDFNYRKIAGKTALHFNNPLLLKFQLSRKPGQELVDDEELGILNHAPEPAEQTNEPETVQTDSVTEAEHISPVEEIPAVQQLEKIDMTGKIENIIPAEAEIPEQKAEEPVKTENIQEISPVIKEDKKEELLFEPLYTTDYFASQGIKLSEEVQQGDKLGKQLRSFTDWLKTMKKVHQGKLPEASNIDVAVQNMAENSNKEEEVLTESMAEVFIQQGKTEKAHEIYKKLSLLNPAKSAYFAAKIELLKEK